MPIQNQNCVCFIAACLSLLPFGSVIAAATPSLASEDPSKAPGVVIDHSPKSSGIYIGSPSIAVWTNGDYIASHDYFGKIADRTLVFGSSDRGATWHRQATVRDQYWSTLFVHRGALYLIGTTAEYGNIVIRRSLDGGSTWTTPANASSGLLLSNGGYHCAPVPVIVHDGRLWRAFERRDPATGWGITFRAGMLSAPVNADLLDASHWTVSNFLPSDPDWLGNQFGGWLEGNAVVSPEGKLIDLLRVDTRGYPERAAIVNISSDGRAASFDPQTGFVDLPGGAKKFTVRFDPASRLYWAIATPVLPGDQAAGQPGRVRNTLALISSPDLLHWTGRSILFHHPDTRAHGFQYVDWLFEEEDIIAVCRTAFDDGLGGAHNYHDANYLTFHRIKHFRDLAPTALK